MLKNQPIVEEALFWPKNIRQGALFTSGNIAHPLVEGALFTPGNIAHPLVEGALFTSGNISIF